MDKKENNIRANIDTSTEENAREIKKEDIIVLSTTLAEYTSDQQLLNNLNFNLKLLSKFNTLLSNIKDDELKCLESEKTKAHSFH